MIEYIPRQAAIAAVIEARMPDTTPDGTPIANGKRSVSDCVRRIRDIPAEDVHPVKHGKNLDRETPSIFTCSVCGWHSWDTYCGDTSEYNYCPNCGALMGDEDDV